MPPWPAESLVPHLLEPGGQCSPKPFWNAGRAPLRALSSFCQGDRALRVTHAGASPSLAASTHRPGGLPRTLANEQSHVGQCAGPYLPAGVSTHEGPPHRLRAWQCRVPPTSFSTCREKPRHRSSEAEPQSLCWGLAGRGKKGLWTPFQPETGSAPRPEPEPDPSWKHAGADDSHVEEGVAWGS